MNVEGIKGHLRQVKNLEYILKSKKIPQTILFTGPAGIGKKLIGKRFLSALFCRDINPPCLSCQVCRQIDHLTFPDLIEIYPNEKGAIPIGSEENSDRGSVRWLISRLSAKSITGKTGILIDCVDRITEEGQNALLKTIEEPSPGTCFVLISSNRNNLLPTILSRCTEIRFFPLADSYVKEIILTKYSDSYAGFNPDMLAVISGGSVEIAEMISDQEVFNRIIEICKAISEFLKEENIFDVDIGIIQNKIKSELFLDVIINIYRQNLVEIISNKNDTDLILKEIFISDKKKLMYLLKILIFLKRSGANNLNVKYALKGLLYSSVQDNNLLQFYG